MTSPTSLRDLSSKIRLCLGIVAALVMTILSAYLLPGTPLSTDLIGEVTTPWPTNKLHVRVSRSLVQPGESYILYASDYVGFAPRAHEGMLDYRLTVCDAQTGMQCGTPTEGPWGSYELRGGQVRVELPGNMPLGVYVAQFRPRGRSEWEWSNPATVNVGTTVGLRDMARYWLLDGNNTYVGTNHVTGSSYRARIGYVPSTVQCPWMPTDAKTMQFTKDSRDGYWSPNYNIPSVGDGRHNLRWHLRPWARDKGWHDEYLTALGHENYAFGSASDPQSTAFEENFTTNLGNARYGSREEEFPGYILSPHWAGQGWGMVNTNQTYGFGSDICSAAQSGGLDAVWGVHVDDVTLALPRYQGPAVRVRFYEDMPGWGWTIVENWYFVQDKGLVRIEQKMYGGATIACGRDPDCLVNATMTAPMNELTLEEYAAPQPSTAPSPTSAPDAIDVSHDYDGDGRMDQASWRGSNGVWTIRRSSDGQTVETPWGAGYAPYLDVPIPADFDGDGRTDLAVRRTGGTVYVVESSTGQWQVIPPSTPTPTPVPTVSPQQCATLCTSDYHCCAGQGCVVPPGKVIGRCRQGP